MTDETKPEPYPDDYERNVRLSELEQSLTDASHAAYVAGQDGVDTDAWLNEVKSRLERAELRLEEVERSDGNTDVECGGSTGDRRPIECGEYDDGSRFEAYLSEEGDEQ